MANTNIQFLLTSAEPLVTQIYPAQSIGGYPSLTPYANVSTLLDNLDHYIDSVVLSNSFSAIPDAVSIDNELMSVSQSSVLGAYGEESLIVQRGSYGSSPTFHAVGDAVYSHRKTDLFNSSFSNNNQYRCIAIKNTTDSIFQNCGVYIKQASSNPNSTISIALETPIDTVISSSATSSTLISITDSSLAGLYADNTFENRVIVIDDPTSVNFGLSRQIASYSGNTGTFTFINSFTYPLEVGKTYHVEQSPSQRLLSGRVSPSANSNVSSFVSQQGLINQIMLNFSGQRTNGNTLMAYETIYLWIARDISSNTDKYVNNSFVFTLAYRNS